METTDKVKLLMEELESLDEKEKKLQTEATNQIAKSIRETLESLGVRVVNVEIYRSGFDDNNHLIIAAYLPKKACLFKVYATVSKNNNVYNRCAYVCSVITTELNNEGYKKYLNDGEKFLLKRVSIEETQSQKKFSINDYDNISYNNIEDDIKNNMRIFKDFVEIYGEMLEKSFSEITKAWYLPEIRYGAQEAHHKMNDEILEKFPKEIFSKNQT